MQPGKVKWFDNDKGYGFIESNGKDYFVHHKEILGDGYRTLVTEQQVTFMPDQGPKGNIARQVVKI